MEVILSLFSFILHIDKHLTFFVSQYGVITYVILFVIVFMETGFVITPFLPGDSLLFAAGTLSGIGALELYLLLMILTSAAVLGDTINYWIGRTVGPRVFREKSRFFKKEHLDRTAEFYEKHGGKTIILARFIPIIRTFAPFVAGIGNMNYSRFLAYNVFGGVLWVSAFTLGGHLFGNIPQVRENFTFVIMAIIVISVLPLAVEWYKIFSKNKARAQGI